MDISNDNKWNKIERFIGSLKFAVIVIGLFSLWMIAGTFLESFYGTDFANRVVYKTWHFMLIQFGMLLSIIFATILRLPPKKRLYGFYVIHTGLIIIGIGSLITYVAGVDGHITLSPNEPNRQVILSKDILKLTYEDSKKVLTSFLPYSAFSSEINEKLDGVTLLTYLPFAEGKLSWIETHDKYIKDAPTHSSRYFFKNSFAEQEIFLSVHPEADEEFSSAVNLGPLVINYHPQNLARCFSLNESSKVIFWDAIRLQCFTPEEKGLIVRKTKSNKTFITLEHDKKLLTFFPELSPFPLNEKLESLTDSPIRALPLTMFEQRPFLFLFGKTAAFYNKENKKWESVDMEIGGKAIRLPWMKGELKLLEHEASKAPHKIPEAIIPIQKNGDLIKGQMRALKVEVAGRYYWITNNTPLTISINGKKATLEITKETITLPFELALTKFKMDKDPGTDNPASYESFVKLFSNGQMSTHHIYMNNPMKNEGFTFYQASYFQDEQGHYSSNLSVNVDQGRALKYLGSLMLVFGAIWHFSLNKKKIKKD